MGGFGGEGECVVNCNCLRHYRGSLPEGFRGGQRLECGIGCAWTTGGCVEEHVFAQASPGAQGVEGAGVGPNGIAGIVRILLDGGDCYYDALAVEGLLCVER